MSCSSGPDDQDIGESAVENAGPIIPPESATCQGIRKRNVSLVELSLSLELLLEIKQLSLGYRGILA